MAVPTPIFLGYRLKGRPINGLPALPPHVTEIASMSDCIRGRPEDDLESWTGFNAAACYDTPAQALATLPPLPDALDAPTPFELFAFALIPILYTRDTPPRALNVLTLLGCDPSTLPPRPTRGLLSLGFDAISFSPFQPTTSTFAPCMASFNCSPLSCNGLANELTVNQHCLFPDLESATTAAARFAQTEPWSAPYVVVEVLRQAAHNPTA